MVSGHDFIRNATDCIAAIERDESAKIRRVAEVCAEVILAGGILHVFGSGHSTLPAREIAVRAGTLSCVQAIALEEIIGKFERIEGVAETLLKDYDLRSGEVIIIFSNGGINPLPIEMATLAKGKGLFTVGVTSMAQSSGTQSRHSSGKRLYEVVDVAIDTHVPFGDASIELAGTPMKIGPLSTIGAVTVANAIIVDTVGQILARGGVPPVRISRNIPGGDEHNKQFKQKYGDRIRGL